MSKKKVVYINYPPYYQEPRRYGCFNFLLDFVLLVLTCGLWFFVILFRDWRR